MSVHSHKLYFLMWTPILIFSVPIYYRLVPVAIKHLQPFGVMKVDISLDLEFSEFF